MVQAGSGGQYQPNPKDWSPGAENSENPKMKGFLCPISLPEADDFDVEKVCEAIDPDKVWKTPGQAKFFWNGFVLRIFVINKKFLRIRL